MRELLKKYSTMTELTKYLKDTILIQGSFFNEIRISFFRVMSVCFNWIIQQQLANSNFEEVPIFPITGIYQLSNKWKAIGKLTNWTKYPILTFIPAVCCIYDRFLGWLLHLFVMSYVRECLFLSSIPWTLSSLLNYSSDQWCLLWTMAMTKWHKLEPLLLIHLNLLP